MRNLRPKTMDSYEKTLKLLARWLREEQGIDRWESVREPHIRAYIRDLQERGKYTYFADEKALEQYHLLKRRDERQMISPITINNYLRNMSGFFNWMVACECIVKSPMRKIKAMPQERKPREYLEDDEVQCLLKSMDRAYFAEYRDLMAMMLMLDAGTRLGETLSAEISQVNLEACCLQIPAEKSKARKERTVFFSRKTAKELRHWLQYKDRYCESNYIFPVKSTGRPLDVRKYEKNFALYIKRVGITKHITPHTLRNNFAKRCLMNGMDIYTLSRLLGHSSVTVTEQAYLDVKDEDIRKRYSRFSPIETIINRS